jgi:hypothetical protein
MDGWFLRVIALFIFVWPYVRPHILCTQLVICLLSHFIHIWYLGWPWSEYAHIIPILWMVDFSTVIALFMFVWQYVRSHILCTPQVICLLSHFIYILNLGWPLSQYAHIIPISPMVDFCESHSPFHVSLTICRPHILCTQLVICLLSHFIHIWYLGWPWSEYAHFIPISRMVDHCESHSPFHVCLTICPFAHLVYATSHLSFVAFYSYLVSWLAMIWACAYYTDFTDGWFLPEL